MPLNFKKLVGPVGKFFIASLALAAVSTLHHTTEMAFGDSKPGRVASLVLIIGLGAIAYFLVAWILKTTELTETLGVFQKKIKSRLAK